MKHLLTVERVTVTFTQVRVHIRHCNNIQVKVKGSDHKATLRSTVTLKSYMYLNKCN